MSKSKIKDEALLFFQVSPEERLKDKKVFKIRLENLLKIKKSTEEFLMQDVLKEKGGKGNHFEIPPADFLSSYEKWCWCEV